MKILFGLLALIPCLASQETIRDLRWMPDTSGEVQFGAATLVEVPAVDSAGFHFPYYLYVPANVARTGGIRLLVEPNNTGTTTDDFEVHRSSAKRMAYCGKTSLVLHRGQLGFYGEISRLGQLPPIDQ